MASPDDTGNVIDLIADSLTLERPDLVRQIFNAAGARTPEGIWSPNEAELRSPLLRQFAASGDIC